MKGYRAWLICGWFSSSLAASPLKTWDNTRMLEREVAFYRLLRAHLGGVEVQAAIRTGSPEPVRKRRFMFRKNFAFNDQWRGKHYAIKQVAPIVAGEADRLVVVTVFVYYF